MPTPFHYLDDPAQLPRLVTKLYENGYVPTFTRSEVTSSNTYRHKVRVANHRGTKFGPEPLPIEDYLTVAKAEPHLGIGVSSPQTRSTDLLLVGLDCDIHINDDPTIQQVLASVIQKPCPTRYGGKGCAMFVAIKADYDRDWLKERNLKTKDIVGPPLKNARDPSLKGAPSRLECTLFSAMQHLVIPPSRYPQVSAPDDVREYTDRFYTWIPFPSIDPRKQVELALYDVPVRELPVITEGRLFEISIHIRDPENAIRKFIEGDSWQCPGDGEYRSRLGKAIHRFVFDGFPDDYIQRRCLEIAHDHLARDPNPEWGDTDQPLIDDIAGWIKGSRVKKAEQKLDPVSVGQGGRKQQTDDRVAADFLAGKFRADDVYSFDGQLYWWSDAGWLRLEDRTLYNEIYRSLPMLGHNHIMNAIKMWTMTNFRPAPPANPTCILFPNGMFDVITHELRDPRKEDFNPHMMKCDFDPIDTPVYLKHMKQMLTPPDELLIPTDEHDAVREQNLNLFEEFIGYCMVRSYRFQKMLFLIGPPNAGKGTVWRFIGRTFPERSVSTIGFDDLGDPNVRLQMVGTLVNIGSEVGRKDRTIDDILNKITAHEPVNIWKMHVSREQVTLMSRLIFDGNLPPNSSDGTGAFKRRAMIMMGSALPAGTKVLDSETYDAMWDREAPGILARWAMAYKRLIERGKFDEPDYMSAQTEEIRIDSNPVIKWCEECCTPSKSPEASSNLYAAFRDWAIFHGYSRPPADNVWGKIMKQNGYPVHILKIGGQNVRARYCSLVDEEPLMKQRALNSI